MGRSKFPGKPSKQCYRKRVNVLPKEDTESAGATNNLQTVTRAQDKDQEEESAESESEYENPIEDAPTSPQTSITNSTKARSSQRQLNTSLRKNSRKRNFITKVRSKNVLSNSLNNRKSGILKRQNVKLKRRESTKFVLPTRSVHSSRVIKPNKRFLEISNDGLCIKRKVESEESHEKVEEAKNDSAEKDKMTFTNGHRVILRQARLKLPTDLGKQGPFSTKLDNGPGTIICGVCGAVRYYRFVKQARKFNIYSCEACRKFISKQIKRQKVSNAVLPCHLGQGACYISSAMRSHHWKITKNAYKSRCPACWLKQCLKSYHLPQTIKQNLTQMLPRNMRGLDFTFSHTLPPILWQRNLEKRDDEIDLNIKQRPVRFKVQKQPSESKVPASVSSEIKRQKVDLKGPRVKHVCRSASIVLGQPIARFERDVFSQEKEIIEKATDKIEDTEEESKSGIEDAPKKEDLDQDTVTTSDDDLTSSTGISKIYLDKSAISRAERVQNFLNSTEDCLSQISDDDEEDNILVDYPAELNYRNNCKQGFALIGSERFSVESVCFLCGSAGLDSMLVCALCCEPYHSFCVEDFLMDSNCSTTIDWICARCTPCEGCKSLERQKVNCPKCRKCYHLECLSLEEGPNSILCKECTRCQNCNSFMSDNNFLLPANNPLCEQCLEHQRYGGFCPICQKKFESNNLLKVVQCSKCTKWIHSECEKLTSDQYDILKLLPSAREFTCSSCLSEGDFTWHNKLQTEICLSLSKVIKLLGRKVKSKLKSSRQSFLKTPLHVDIDNNNCDKDFPSVISSKTLLSIKSRICTYSSVKQFDEDITEALQSLGPEIIIVYKNILQSIFPWYNKCHEQSLEHISITYHHHSDYNEKHKNTLSVLPPREKDCRSCALCKKTGDGLVNQESRLLYCGQNTWIHANCAYWSSEVFEKIDNHLQNVLETIENSQGTWCSICRNSGASIWCTICKTDRVHFLCARRSNWIFARIKKVCFCPKHSPPVDEQISVTEHDFSINRSVFIEQTNEKGMRQLADKVSCTIGSLSILKLGRIEPLISDTSDAIIPAGFVCSRVFWSTLEPWRLVPYVITTSVQNPNCNTLTVDKNFTVDHSLPKLEIDKLLKDLSAWQREHDKKEVSSDTEDEEEKTGAELLSPELTDTILKDLPHDLLDGISVQDIFPNFTYEDVLNMDNSNAESLVECFKKVDEEESLDAVKEWSKSKFDSKLNFTRMPPLNHLTLSYKLDAPLPNILASSTKKRPGNSMPLLLQVDGNFDDEDSDDCPSPSEMITFNPWPEEPVTCEKCQSTYRTQASYKRHLDSCEALCSSESESENAGEMETINHTGLEYQSNEQTVQISEPYQDVVFSSFESYQSQVQTAVVNVVPEPQPVIQPTSVALPEPSSNPSISIPVPICVGTPLVQHALDFQAAQTPQVSLQSVVLPRQQTVRTEPSNSVIMQPLAATRSTHSFVPILDSFQQTSAPQNMQYVATLAPQQVAVPTQQLVQILPSIQPTVILQQPQQLILDSNGTLTWAQPPPQPVYYGFETIVQNTVMQSQQFLPSAVPGMLTANSSYSTTTQVFQTSKLEPVLDMSSNSFLLVNSNGQVELSQIAQAPNNILQAQSTPTLIYSQMPSLTQKALPTSNNCINLPSAPFVSDPGIPMNIVPPIPKATPVHNRPMSRVLPMPTKQSKTVKSSIVIDETKKSYEEKILDKIPQLKLEEKRKLVTKDSFKTIDHTKMKLNKKVEIVDYKVVNAATNIKTSPEVVKLKSPTSLKEFEPVEKMPKYSAPMAARDKITERMNVPVYKKAPKLLQQIEPAKLFQQLEEQKCVKIGSIDVFEKTPKVFTKEPKPSMPSILHIDKNISKPMTTKPIKLHVQKEEIENQKPPEIKKSICEKDIHQQEIDYKFISTKQSAMIAALRPLRTQTLQTKVEERFERPLSTKEGFPKLPTKKDNEKPHAPPSLYYTIENREGFQYSSTSVDECWEKMLDAVQKARAAHNMPSLPVSNGKLLKSVSLLGLKSSHVRYLVEQLPEASKCHKYKPLFKFIPNEQINVKDSTFGAARNEPWNQKNAEPYDMFSWLCSRHRKPFDISEDQQTIQSRRVNNLPTSMKFRNLKHTSKFSVGVYRSNIHGRGLFCLRDIDPGEMVIEYAGEVIRSILTDKREKLYNSKGIGCYMFRVDDNFVVDATMKGNAARFINHSCDPNCYSKVVEILGHKHIIIFALRRIHRGEELTYDYKFPFEEDKIPCTCGAKRCRKFLN